VSGLGVERNLFRYRPISGVAVRATTDAAPQTILRVAVAGIRSGAPFSISAPTGLPPAVRRALSELGVGVFVEDDEQFVQRIAGAGESRPARVRLVGPAASVAAAHRAIAEATDGDPDLAVYDNEVTTAGRLELLPFLHEQAIAITAHRFGNPDAWSEAVI
jgi:RHH-type transcriptional regulator, proline utilization regulon repressor / proline dehydrogenase / delta 1-pyrroline-5-carboxylate dehydrogenase